MIAHGSQQQYFGCDLLTEQAELIYKNLFNFLFTERSLNSLCHHSMR